MLQITHLLDLADEYQRHDPVEDKTLSFRVFGDSKKLSSLRTGSDLTTTRFNAAVLWFHEHWPEGAHWPDLIERPVAILSLDAVPQQDFTGTAQ